MKMIDENEYFGELDTNLGLLVFLLRKLEGKTVSREDSNSLVQFAKFIARQADKMEGELEELKAAVSFPQPDYHEVSDSITWDGDKASVEAIWEAVPEWVPFVNARPCGSELILRLDLPTGWRIQITGDSFAILPPAQDGDA